MDRRLEPFERNFLHVNRPHFFDSTVFVNPCLNRHETGGAETGGYCKNSIIRINPQSAAQDAETPMVQKSIAVIIAN